jgi:hypothetical protein
VGALDIHLSRSAGFPQGASPSVSDERVQLEMPQMEDAFSQMARGWGGRSDGARSGLLVLLPCSE